MKTLSICIPTFNRANCLRNCLNSIYESKKNSELNFDVCISDNNSTDDTQLIVDEYNNKLDIKYHKNNTNLGLGLNILKSVELSNSEFAWIIGNDDMIFSNTLEKVNDMLKNYPKVDYFFVNSNHLSSEFVFSHKQPFNHKNLPPIHKSNSDRIL